MKVQIRRIKNPAGILVLGWIGVQEAFAALPTLIQPNNADNTTDWLQAILGYVAHGIEIGALILSGLAFFWLAWIGLAKFNEWRTNRAEGIEVGAVLVFGGVVVLYMGYMLGQAIGVFG